MHILSQTLIVFFIKKEKRMKKKISKVLLTSFFMVALAGVSYAGSVDLQYKQPVVVQG